MQEILKPEVNHYQLTELMGEGLSSRVYRATRTDSRGHSSQIVAIKMLKSQQHVRLLVNEFETLCRVRSAHCVSVLGWENFASNSALILEFVNGVSLEQLIRTRRVTPPILDELTRQVQLGLLYLQSQRLCHGDLSPGNILIDIHGVVRLVDFGLANWSARENFGTPAFLAPERWKRATPDFSSDLYALGLIRQHVDSGAAVDFLMEMKPRHRQPLALAENPRVQEEIGEIVSRLLTEQVKVPMATQSLSTIPLSQNIKSERPQLKVIGGLKWMWWLVLLLVPIAPPGGEIAETVQPASLEIRSQSWLWATLNGHHLGYAPIRVRAVYPGKYRLNWRMAHFNGSRDVAFSAGEHKVLTEADFREKSR